MNERAFFDTVLRLVWTWLKGEGKAKEELSLRLFGNALFSLTVKTLTQGYLLMYWRHSLSGWSTVKRKKFWEDLNLINCDGRGQQSSTLIKLFHCSIFSLKQTLVQKKWSEKEENMEQISQWGTYMYCKLSWQYLWENSAWCLDGWREDKQCLLFLDSVWGCVSCSSIK